MNIKYHIKIIYDNDKPVFKDYKKLNNYEKFYTKTLYLIEKQNKIDIIIDKITNAEEYEIENIMEKLLNVSNK